MKYLFVIASFAICSFASAQNDDLYYFKKRFEKQQGGNKSLPFQSPVLLPDQMNILNLTDPQEYTLANGNKVSILSQDKMSCIKPDMSQFNMPNAGTKDMLRKNIAAIPNVSPQQRIFKSFSADKTKKSH